MQKPVPEFKFRTCAPVLVPLIAMLSVSTAAAQDAENLELEEVVVTGSRIAQTGFVTPTPVTMLGVAELEQRAPASIAEALYELPTFRNVGPTQNNRGTSTVGMNVLDLRSLGATRTLVLLDGRRFVPANTTTSWDVNLIPSGLVERTEVVTGGASAAYGSDAVAGVVNFILKDKLEGLNANVHYGMSEYSDNKEVAVNLSGGMAFAAGRGHVIAGLDYSDNKGVGKNIGFYARDWGKREYGRLTLGGNRPAGVPANLITNNVEFSNATPGGLVLGSTTTTGAASTLLRGTAFGANGSPYPFQFGTLVGSDQMTGSNANYNYSLTGRQALRTPLERINGLVRVNYDLLDNLNVFAEYLYGRGEGHGNTAQAYFSPSGPGGAFGAGQLVINATNPYLPQATRDLMSTNNLRSINVGRLLEESQPFNTNNTNTTNRIVVGAKGTLGSNWTWDTYFESGKNQYNIDVPNIIDIPNFRAAINVVDNGSGPVCGPATPAGNPNLNAARAALVQPGCQPLNVLGINSASAAAIDYVTGHMQNYVTSKQESFAANFGGSIEPVDIGAGPLAIALGVDWRQNQVDSVTDARSQVDANYYGNYKPIHGKLRSLEEYLEVLMPLLQDKTFAKSLDFNAAVRSTDYSLSGRVTTWKAGLTYKPVEALLFRATKSRDIRAPNIGELYQAGAGGIFTGSNPATGGSGTANIVATGNPALTPEIADTFTAGVSIQPIDSLRVSLDYFAIVIDDVIAPIGNPELVTRCFVQNQASACALFTIDPTVPLGFTQIRNAPLNLNRQKANGADLEIAWRVPLDVLSLPGEFNIRSFVTWTNQLETFSASGSLGNRAGSNEGTDLGMPHWRGTVNFTYELDRLTTSLQYRAFSKVKYGVAFIGPEDTGYSPTLGNSINTNRYPGFGYVNWSVQYAFGDMAKPIKVYFNVDNVLDRDPPFGWVQEVATYDTLGRTYKLGVRASL